MEVIKISKSKSKENIFQQNLRVVAYIRVSTKLEKQTYSFESQKIYYQNLINCNVGWQLIKIYEDFGISGTTIDKRLGFQEMMNDALKKKYDYIVTKSISRFARNTVDLLNYVRFLKSRNIGVYFEEENINTLNCDTEMMLSILGSIAEMESINISSRIMMGYKMRLESGTIIDYKSTFGYKYNKKSKKQVVNKKEAEIIKLIFEKFIEGKSKSYIANYLNNNKLYRKGKKWNSNQVYGILKNRKYTGVREFRKKVKDDVFSKYNVNKNKYECLIENIVPVIINKETYEEANSIIQSRKNLFIKKQEYNEFDSLLIGKIICGFCYKIYRKSGAKYKTNDTKWLSVCKECKNIKVSSNIMISLFKELMLKISNENFNFDIKKINANLRRLSKSNEVALNRLSYYVEEYSNSNMDYISYKNKVKELRKLISANNDEMTEIALEKSKKIDYQTDIINLKKLIKEIDLDSDAIELFRQIILCVIVGRKTNSGYKKFNNIRFIFNNSNINEFNKNLVRDKEFITILEYKSQVDLDIDLKINKSKKIKTLKVSFEVLKENFIQWK